MPKVKVPRKSTFIDMTAMSDVTVLLLTFFILTSTFIKPEPVQVTTPPSVSEIKIPEINVLSILVEPGGKVFMSLDKQDDAMQVLKKVGEDYNIEFTDKEIYQFGLSATSSFGVPIDRMKGFLGLPDEQRNEILKNYGIPMDSIDNQFKHWVRHARSVNPNLLIAIKADQTTPYPVIKTVMTSLQELRENKYNLITSLKAGGNSEEKSGH
jgi:biopolymer transport protein ExbD